MLKNQHALLFGTREGAQWHPLDGIDLELQSILAGLVELEITTDRDHLGVLEEGGFRLLVCYADAWEERLSDGHMAEILRFAAAGGGVLVIHNGISWQKRPEFQALVGARFTGHPAVGTLEFRAVNPDHPACDDVPAAWTMDEEPYRFEAHGATEATVLYEYRHEGRWHPAAWASSFGRGRVVYLMPGHSLGSFKVDAYRSLIRSSAAWLLA
jgi:type 1 glutamine amidotransferase